MSVAQAIASVVQFYEDLYGGASASSGGFRCHGNALFMHPVMTPNFLVAPTLKEASLIADADLMVTRWGLSRHWVNLFPSQDNPELLASAGYDRGPRCVFNFFSQPLQRATRLERGEVRIVSVRRLSGQLRTSYEDGATRNCVNLPVVTLRLIETVLERSKGELSYALALTPAGTVLGALTLVRAARATLFINAWVDAAQRQSGIMSELFCLSSRQEFEAKQESAFYWTMNPIVAAFGEVVLPVQIYTRKSLGCAAVRRYTSDMSLPS